jgi:hypothetical protein
MVFEQIIGYPLRAGRLKLPAAMPSPLRGLYPINCSKFISRLKPGLPGLLYANYACLLP